MNLITSSGRRNRIVTFPNFITLSSLALLLPTHLALRQEKWLAAGCLLLAIFFSDAVDGFLARRLKQETDFGAVADSVRDFLVKLYFWSWLFTRVKSIWTITGILLIGLIETAIALVNLNTAWRCRAVQLTSPMGKLRGFLHFRICIPLYLWGINLIDISLPYQAGYFLYLLAVSLFTFFVYYEQRKELVSQIAA